MKKKAEERLRDTNLSSAEVAKLVGVCRATLHRHVDVEAIRGAK